ncbi:YbfB/YjiJ family MFS transporter [Ciceribacter azotifigens]|uniref:YbfB/YjiJ family MFS transporter n=1 Tax=Ciceribacter azotifigens TaxID=2069303 RepID=UPI003A8A9DAB
MSSRHSVDPSLLSTAVAGAAAMASAMGFGRFVFTPILPGMIADVPLSSSAAGLVAAGNFAGYLAGAILAAFGWAAGRERLIALVALFVSSVALAAMGVTGSVALFVVIRFVAGVASAFALIFTSSIVLTLGAARRSEGVQSAHFGGVGVGIALSSLMVFLTATWSGHDPSAWRAEWLTAAAVTLVLFAVVWMLLPPAPRTAGPAQEAPLAWRLPLTLLTLSYGLFGFGYVITATFIVTMARMSEAGAAVEFLTWFLTGIAAAVSIAAWRPLLARLRLAGLYLIGLLVEAAGVLASVALPGIAAPLAGGVLLGATFMMITAYGLRLGRSLAPESPRRALAFMTAAFGIGQIIGPLVAGWVAEATGGFTVASILGALALLLAAVFAVPVWKRVG